MLTFTCRGGLTRDELILCVQECLASIRAVGHELPAIMVPEIHTGTHEGGTGENLGTIHGHAAVNWPGFIDYTLVYNAWNRALRNHVPRFAEAAADLSLGTVNVGRERSAPTSLAKYLSKYLAKDFASGIAHKKRYVCYGPVRRPVKTAICLPAEEMPSVRSLVEAAMDIAGQDRGFAVSSTYNQVFLVDNLELLLGDGGGVSGSSRPPAPTPVDIIAQAVISARGSAKPLSQAESERELEVLLAKFEESLAPVHEDPHGWRGADSVYPVEVFDDDCLVADLDS
jgi:hypothetical protein